MRNLLKYVSMNRDGSYAQHLSGFYIPSASIPYIQQLASIGRFLAKDKSWHIYGGRFLKVTTADALNAFSVNDSTGEVWFGNQKVATYDPARYKCAWAIPAATVLYAAAQGTMAHHGVNSANVAGSITGTAANVCYGEINPARTAINAMVAGAALEIYFLTYER
jgi:hypothetical protein